MLTMEEGREQATQAISDVFSALQNLGLGPKFADGGYSACTEDSVGWRYKTKGRLDHPAGQSGSLAFARRVRDALAADEWAPLDGVLWTVDGIQDAEDRWIVRAAREDVEIDVTSYGSEPLVLVRVLGPCLPTAESERQHYRAAETERIEVGDNPDGES